MFASRKWNRNYTIGFGNSSSPSPFYRHCFDQNKVGANGSRPHHLGHLVRWPVARGHSLPEPISSASHSGANLYKGQTPFLKPYSMKPELFAENLASCMLRGHCREDSSSAKKPGLSRN